MTSFEGTFRSAYSFAEFGCTGTGTMPGKRSVTADTALRLERLFKQG